MKRELVLLVIWYAAALFGMLSSFIWSPFSSWNPEPVFLLSSSIGIALIAPFMFWRRN